MRGSLDGSDLACCILKVITDFAPLVDDTRTLLAKTFNELGSLLRELDEIYEGREVGPGALGVWVGHVFGREVAYFGCRGESLATPE